MENTRFNKIIEKPKEDDELVGERSQMQQGYNNVPWAAKQVRAKAQSPQVSYTDKLVDKLSKETGPETDRWLEQIEASLADAKDLNDVADILLTMYQGMDVDQLAGGVRQALLTAELEGHNEVKSRR